MKLFFVAGEHSGDLYGSRLLQALQSIVANCKFFGVGGPLMRAKGMECCLEMEQFQVMGFTQVVCRFPAICKQFLTVRRQILTLQPEVVVLIDYPGFNMRLAKSLRKKGYRGKIVQYISPTVWAWGAGRIEKLAQTLDLLLTIFPFEKALFSKTSLFVKFVGHPLLEILQSYSYDTHWRERLQWQNSDHPILAVFPGSRMGEITRLLPRQLEAACHLQQSAPLQIAISCAEERFNETISSIATSCRVQAYCVPQKYSYELMRECRSAIAKCGTVNLELALHKKPSAIVYELSYLNHLILRHLISSDLKYYSIVNILSDQEIYPELVKEKFSAHQLYKALVPLHVEGAKRLECLKACEKVASLFSTKSASVEAAQAIMRLIA